MRIRVLYIDGCPNVELTVERVRRAAHRHGIQIVLTRVGSEQEAVSSRFLGSPTVQIDGIDIDPTARSRRDFALGCRLYGASGVPEESVIAEAIRRAS